MTTEKSKEEKAATAANGETPNGENLPNVGSGEATKTAEELALELEELSQAVASKQELIDELDSTIEERERIKEELEAVIEALIPKEQKIKKAQGRLFEDYLRENGHPDGMEFSEFVLRVTADKKGSLNAFVRPNPHSGETIGLTISGNSVTLG